MRIAWLFVCSFCACAPAAPCPPSAPAQAPLPPAAAPALTPTPTPTPPTADARAARDKVAVIPFEDDELFRDERKALREALALRLARLLPDHELVPLAEVDAKLRPIAKSGVRCAFDAEPLARRARNQGWLTTSLLHVSGFRDKPEELWVDLSNGRGPERTFGSLWDRKLARVARYQHAFASLALLPGAGLLGGLSGTFTPKGEVTVGELSLCQRHGFADCVPETKSLTDRAAELTACFAGVDEERRDVLFEGKRCELENLDDLGGSDGKREACVCAALGQSAGVNASAGRWRLSLHYEAKDLVGKARPELRVLESSTNLHAEDDFHSLTRQENGKTVHSSVRRLTVDNLDQVRPALARCALGPASLLVAELDVSEHGTADAARVLTGAKDRRAGQCVEKALRAATFGCTSDGAPAKLRVSIEWPSRTR